MGAETPAPSPNVLFIAIDDLRPQLGCYGQQQMRSPHIDQLAERGVVFEQAYCTVPVCGASRASLLTGLRPTSKRFLTAATYADRDAPGIVSLNQWFKQHGYTTISNGKIYHHPEDNRQGWSEPAWRADRENPYQLPENQAILQQRKKLRRVLSRNGPPFEAADVPDNAYGDGRTLEKSLADLRRLSESEQPFFLAVGFYKPHLPFVAPKKYWDSYDPNAISLPNTYAGSTGVPRDAYNNWAELRGYAGVPQTGPLSEATAKHLIHGYYACVSYVDALVGRLLTELRELDADQNTIIILWGDHGWNLGDHSLWCKHSCFETAMHAPLIVVAPGVSAGHRTPALVEFTDIYPTLCDLAGLPAPEHLQGVSVRPLLKDPAAPWKQAAFGRFRNGQTVKTPTHRFTQYSNRAGAPIGDMLFDHQRDPRESKNVASDPQNGALLEDLRRQLEKVPNDLPLPTD